MNGKRIAASHIKEAPVSKYIKQLVYPGVNIEILAEP